MSDIQKLATKVGTEIAEDAAYLGAITVLKQVANDISQTKITGNRVYEMGARAAVDVIVGEINKFASTLEEKHS